MRLRNRRIATFALAACLAAGMSQTSNSASHTANSASFSDGLAAYRSGNPAQAWRLLRPLAEQGDVQSQNMLGLLYSLGGGGWPEDHAQAAHWFRQAADLGNNKAQYSLGRMYANGEGVRRNYHQAAYWFTAAADQGNQRAQLQLARLYDMGAGVPRDPGYALNLWHSLAENGWSAAQFELAKKYRKGERVRRNMVKAYKWASLAARNSQNLAAGLLAEMVSKKMTAAQVSQALAEARTWQSRRNPSQRALNELVYQFGESVEGEGSVRLLFTPLPR